MLTQGTQLLQQACLTLLKQYPDGLSEYQLLRQLRDKEITLLPELDLHDHLGLFRSHFMLFHALYRLRDQLYAERRYLLQISALHIGLSGYHAGEAALCEADPLRDYYLDLNNLDTTGKEEVTALLTDFWRRMQQGEPERVAAALEVLELETADSFEQVRQQYKRLVMQHHPDRGGEGTRMHALQEALAVLRVHLGG